MPRWHNKYSLEIQCHTEDLQNRYKTARPLTYQVKVGDKVTKETNDNGENVEDVAIIAPNLETDISTDS